MNKEKLEILYKLLKQYKAEKIIRPTLAQMKRGDTLHGKKYTMVIRPQNNGKILVAAVYGNGKFVNENYFKSVKGQPQAIEAVKTILKNINQEKRKK